MIDPVPVCGLILAAGAGTRFGAEPKQLAPFRGRPLLEHAIAAQTAVPALARIVVVLGARAEEIIRGVDFGRAEPVVCAAWADGQSASLRAGAGALAEAHTVIVTLGDEPLIDSALIARFVHHPPRSRATFDGRPGHPVVLGPEELTRLRTLRGDVGARALLAGGALIECGARAGDVDTPADLAALAARG